MLTPKAHKIAIHIAFVVLAVWLVLQSLVLPLTIRINGGGYTATHDESEKQLIDRRIADYTFATGSSRGFSRFPLSRCGVYPRVFTLHSLIAARKMILTKRRRHKRRAARSLKSTCSALELRG